MINQRDYKTGFIVLIW